MTLELNQVAAQVKVMGRSLDEQTSAHKEVAQQAREILERFSNEQTALNERVVRAEQVQQQLRFDWVGAAPTNEALAQAYPLLPYPERATVMASDGSQIMPDRHAITLYYLINVGSIIYRHGSNHKPETHNPKPILCYEPQDIFDEQNRLISSSEINVRRDIAELEILAELATAHPREAKEPTIALLDGQLTLRVIDLPFNRQQVNQNEYIELINRLQAARVLLAGYVDRPRSSFVVALMHLASLEPNAITEETLRQNHFYRHNLVDTDLFDFLGPGERSAIFAVKAKGTEKYGQTGHAIHFFYLNVGQNMSNMVRVEVPAWIAADREAIDTLQAAIVRQARLGGGYPYVLARAHELAVISSEERDAVEMMLALEMRRQGLLPRLSSKQYNKTLLGRRQSFHEKRKR
jgi:hypothetical protein